MQDSKDIDHESQEGSRLFGAVTHTRTLSVVVVVSLSLSLSLSSHGQKVYYNRSTNEYASLSCPTARDFLSC